ncbi:hypothetical protein HELRODRAFT_123029, partial [Helobdella robusta]
LYNYPQLVTASLKLIFRHFSQKQETISAIKQVQLLITYSDSKNYKQIKCDLEELRLLVEKSELWVTKKKSTNKVLCNNSSIGHHQHPGGHEGQGSSQGHTAPRSSQGQRPVQSRSSRAYNQRLLKNLGVHEAMIELLQIQYDKKNDRSMNEIIQLVHIFIQNFCYRNPANQNLIHQNFNLFLSPGILECETACFIYKDNANLCANLSQSTVQHYITCIEKYGRKSEYLKFLQIIVRSETYVYHRKAQDMIMTGLMDSSEEVLHFYTDSSSIQSLVENMKSQIGPLDPRSSLAYHVDLVNLLACCTEGKNVFTEIRCHSLLSL